jgi:hypothetical protein
VYVQVFIEVGAYTYMSICVSIMFLKIYICSRSDELEERTQFGIVADVDRVPAFGFKGCD